MILALEDTSIILLLFGLMQLVFLGLGRWLLLEIHELNATMAALKPVLEALKAGRDDYFEFRRDVEPKVNEMWKDYTARRARERRSVDDQPSLRGGS